MSADWLTGALVPLAWCWRIARNDGVTIGLTTHDAPLAIDGLGYAPAPGIRPSAIRQARGLGGASMAIEGALTAATIRAEDLAAGRWDGARLTLFVADWSDPDAPVQLIADGWLGTVGSDGTAFTADLDGRDPWLEAALAPETSAECRAELGDGDCRVAMAGRRHRAHVTALDGTQVTLAGPLAGADFVFGRLRWLDGAAKGLSSPILAAETIGEDVVLTLARVEGAPGAVELTEGCDRRAATCAERFANIANFRGEPHLPGIDLLTRFGGA